MRKLKVCQTEGVSGLERKFLVYYMTKKLLSTDLVR